MAGQTQQDALAAILGAIEGLASRVEAVEAAATEPAPTKAVAKGNKGKATAAKAAAVRTRTDPVKVAGIGEARCQNSKGLMRSGSRLYVERVNAKGDTYFSAAGLDRATIEAVMEHGAAMLAAIDKCDRQAKVGAHLPEGES